MSVLEGWFSSDTRQPFASLSTRIADLVNGTVPCFMIYQSLHFMNVKFDDELYIEKDDYSEFLHRFADGSDHQKLYLSNIFRTIGRNLFSHQAVLHRWFRPKADKLIGIDCFLVRFSSQLDAFVFCYNRNNTNEQQHNSNIRHAKILIKNVTSKWKIINGTSLPSSCQGTFTSLPLLVQEIAQVKKLRIANDDDIEMNKEYMSMLRQSNVPIRAWADLDLVDEYKHNSNPNTFFPSLDSSSFTDIHKHKQQILSYDEYALMSNLQDNVTDFLFPMWKFSAGNENGIPFDNDDIYDFPDMEHRGSLGGLVSSLSRNNSLTFQFESPIPSPASVFSGEQDWVVGGSLDDEVSPRVRRMNIQRTASFSVDGNRFTWKQIEITRRGVVRAPGYVEQPPRHYSNNIISEKYVASNVHPVSMMNVNNNVNNINKTLSSPSYNASIVHPASLLIQHRNAVHGLTLFSPSDLSPYLGTLGQGNTGLVYKALHFPSLTYVALKGTPLRIVNRRRQMYGEFEGLFSHIGQKNLIQFHGAFFQRGYVTIMLEYMNRGSLHSFYCGKPIVNLTSLQYICHEILHGLKRLHDVKQIHRDIKPNNILLNSKGQVKITDFGLLRQMSAAEDKITEFCGTLTYLAPERLDKTAYGGYDMKCDIYSFCLTILYVLKGCLPIFSEFKTVWDIQGYLEKNKKFNVYEYVKNVPLWTTISNNDQILLIDFISKCIEFDPNRRYNADDLLNHEFLSSMKKYDKDNDDNDDDNCPEGLAWKCYNLDVHTDHDVDDLHALFDTYVSRYAEKKNLTSKNKLPLLHEEQNDVIFDSDDDIHDNQQNNNDDDDNKNSELKLTIANDNNQNIKVQRTIYSSDLRSSLSSSSDSNSFSLGLTVLVDDEGNSHSLGCALPLISSHLHQQQSYSNEYSNISEVTDDILNHVAKELRFRMEEVRRVYQKTLEKYNV